MDEILQVERVRLVSLLSGLAGLPNPDDPGDPNGPFGPYGPFGPWLNPWVKWELGPGPQPWWLAGPVPDPWVVAGPHPDPWRFAGAGLAMLRIHEIVGLAQASSLFDRNGDAVGRIQQVLEIDLDDWCGTPPRWPKGWPRGWRWPVPPREPTPLDQLGAALAYTAASRAVADEALGSILGRAADRLTAAALGVS